MRKNLSNTTWFSPAILMVTLIGIAISIIVFLIMRNQEYNKSQIDFEYKMDDWVNLFTREIDIHLEELTALSAFYEASEYIDRADFRAVTESALTRHGGTQAIGWMPLVVTDEREEYEGLAQSDGFTEFRFIEQTKSGEFEPASVRGEYFPIYYVEPYGGNEHFLGADPSSRPDYLAIFNQSRASGQILSTLPFTLTQNQAKQYNYVIVAPIYNGESRTTVARNNNFTGFLFAVYRVDTIYEIATNYSTFQGSNINLRLNDVSDPANEQLFYDSFSNSKSDIPPEYRKTIEVAGRRWRISSYPTTEFVAAHRTWMPYVMLLGGLLFTVLLIVYLQWRHFELGMSKGQTRAIIESAIDSIITVDEQGTVKSFNPAAEQVFKYKAVEIIGQNIKVLMPEPYRNQHDDNFFNYLQIDRADVTGIGYEVTGQRKNGDILPIDISISEMYGEGQRMFICMIRDITKRKEVEKSLVEAKEHAEEASRLKSDFLNVISHELRTPLTVMLGNLPLLTNPNDLPELDEIAEISQDIEVSSKHLLALINNLLDISKIEAGKMELRLDMLAATDVVDNAIASIETMAHHKGLRLETQVEELILSADALRLKQILLNLLSNAIKFTDQGKITLTVSSQGDLAYFQVHDTGCGIKQEDLPYIFDNFQQVDGSSTRAAYGTGLGLTITKKLVEMHSGCIDVKSEPGAGSVFSFSVPLAFSLDEMAEWDKNDV